MNEDYKMEITQDNSSFIKANTSQVFYMSNGGSEQWTPRYAVEMMIPFIQHWKNKIIWCPFDTEDSQFVKVLKENGFNVVYSHIMNGQDFFTYEPENWDVLVSNPPYQDKMKFMERADSFGKPWALFLPLNITADSGLNKMFGDCPELTILMPNKRTRFFNKNKPDEKQNQPTFKASYIGRKFFQRQLIGVNFPEKINLSDKDVSILDSNNQIKKTM